MKHLSSSSSSTYVIHHEKLDLKIGLFDIRDVFIHEEIIPELLEKLIRNIENVGYLKHPIILDEKSHVVLDGMHRVAALKRLGCLRIPACMVNYESPFIIVGCWYRVLKEANATSLVLQAIDKLGFSSENVHSIDVDTLGVPPVFAALQGLNVSFLIRSNFRNLREAYNHVKLIEETLKSNSVKVEHETENDAFLKLKEGIVEAVLLTPKLSKKDIVETALSGQVFAYKATRHVIPARPLRINVPLTLLKDEKKTLEQANEELVQNLKKKRLKLMPAGSIIEGRRYEEDVYIFE